MREGSRFQGWSDFYDYGQDYQSNPGKWSTGLRVDNVLIKNVECGTALGISGADSSVTNSTIDTAGEHTHVLGCAATDPDGELAFWSDGITFDGTNMRLRIIQSSMLLISELFSLEEKMLVLLEIQLSPQTAITVRLAESR